ncbi:hypothetical protein ACJMK2_013440 [Sinanodonta woodiana]|uniref:Uncharacterized protein n=1 Tax=Sinanodonta woodiana TaxID=1069815 RepID=A0ABD3UXI5_SINWO
MARGERNFVIRQFVGTHFVVSPSYPQPHRGCSMNISVSSDVFGTATGYQVCAWGEYTTPTTPSDVQVYCSDILFIWFMENDNQENEIEFATLQARMDNFNTHLGIIDKQVKAVVSEQVVEDEDFKKLEKRCETIETKINDLDATQRVQELEITRKVNFADVIVKQMNVAVKKGGVKKNKRSKERKKMTMTLRNFIETDDEITHLTRNVKL